MDPNAERLAADDDPAPTAPHRVAARGKGDKQRDLTLDELADLEDREGPPLTRSVVVGNPEALERFKQTTKSITAKIGAVAQHWAESYREEFAYVDSLPRRERQRYEHKTMPEIRRMMRRSSSVSPQRPRSRSSHARRPGHRRGVNTRAGPDSDEPAPALALAPPPRVALTFGCLTLDRDLWREINR